MLSVRMSLWGVADRGSRWAKASALAWAWRTPAVAGVTGGGASAVKKRAARQRRLW